MMKKVRTSALIFMMLALLVAPLSFVAIAGAAEVADDAATDVQPIEVPELEGTGIAAISAEIDPESDLAPIATVNGEIVPFESLIYKVMESHNQWIVIVGGTLSENTPLPAKIEVAVPTGSPVFWFGQVGGSGDPAQDPRFSGELADMRRTEGEFDVYTAIMDTYRDMQIEYRISHNPFTQGPDGPTVALEYTPWQDVAELRLAAALPPGSAVTASDIEFLGFGPMAEDQTPDDRSPAFARLFTEVQAGTNISTEITYTVTGGGSAASNLNPVVIGGLVAALIAVASVMFYVFAKLARNRSGDDDDDDYYYEEEGEEYADDDVEYDEVEEDDQPSSSPIQKH